MKAVFISFYQAFYDEVIAVLDELEIRGFTYWSEVQGRGSYDGDPHYGTHTWPTLNAAILTFIEDKKVEPLLDAIHQLDLSAPLQGIRAFVMPAEER
ncbi:MAG TPA: hypothetical protein P5134_03680 [Bacteroidales bacterium]|nr:hypothetical protein [Bacteroidales bacterium]HOS57772.1 hypothetical protein [Bacteroidales bacterium]HRR04713.1 hypothetical protein [Bacteroidales bacterium]HRT13689.1 hypothetical protein [Bacteroidales bacterium]HXK73629.1 hypothetical protein [Bacteroidales bacterium]